MNEENLREIISGLARIDVEKVNAATPLSGLLGGSLGRAKLDAGLRAKSGIVNSGVYTASTYGELCKALGLNSTSSFSSTVIAQTPILEFSTLSRGNNIRLGIDAETVAAFPASADYWEDEFYSRTFTPGEIAYALLQVSPAASFAAMWCAKEALRKAYSVGVELGWQQIEVVHAADGKPSLVVDGKHVDGALSLCHTAEMAFAAFVSAQLPQPVISAENTPIPTIAPSVASKDVRAVIIAMVALLFSILAIVVAFLHR